MREQLLGYLLDALEPDERHRVEEELCRNPQLQRELELLDEGLEPLRAIEEPIVPPAGLAERTCARLASYRLRESSGDRGGAAQQARGGGCGTAAIVSDESVYACRRTMADLVVAAGVVFAAALLFFPAIEHSRQVARRDACMNKLMQIHLALAEYAMRNYGYFPAIEPGETAGIYAVRLQEGGYINGDGWNICPGTARRWEMGAADDKLGHVPTRRELQVADRAERARWTRSMGGTYGSTLHFYQGDRYCCTKDRRRATFAIMSDMPPTLLVGMDRSCHGGCARNVLYEDGHVRFQATCLAEGCGDNIFQNDLGYVAAGVRAGDAVIGRSEARPDVAFLRMSR